MMNKICDLVTKLSVESNIPREHVLLDVLEQEQYLHETRFSKKPCRFHVSYFYSALGHVSNSYRGERK
jgi:hypothetical protein